MKTTLAKALKLKNRITEDISKTSRNITNYNSLVEGAEHPYDVYELLLKREKLVEALINLKVAISEANKPIQKNIFKTSELRALIAFLVDVPTTSGKTLDRGRFMETANTVTYEAAIPKVKIDEMIRDSETELDQIQDEIDRFNHTTEIEVDLDISSLLKK